MNGVPRGHIYGLVGCFACIALAFTMLEVREHFPHSFWFNLSFIILMLVVAPLVLGYAVRGSLRGGIYFLLGTIAYIFIRIFYSKYGLFNAGILIFSLFSIFNGVKTLFFYNRVRAKKQYPFPTGLKPLKEKDEYFINRYLSGGSALITGCIGIVLIIWIIFR